MKSPVQTVIVRLEFVNAGQSRESASKPVAKKATKSVAKKASSLSAVVKKETAKTKPPVGGDKIAAVVALCAKNPAGLSAAVLEHKLGFKVAPIVRKAIEAGRLKKTGQTRATLYFAKVMNGKAQATA
jgi:hypothetical protein